ncbi:MAG: hypothetical protein ACREF1_11205 [Acetobacteraceae bacterium]
MFLLDTNVLSSMQRRDRIDPKLASWAAANHPADLFLSVITIVEIELGVLLLKRRDAAQSAVLRGWIEKRVLPSFGARILPVDLAVAQRCHASAAFGNSSLLWRRAGHRASTPPRIGASSARSVPHASRRGPPA